jgi:hypothetical protein
MFIYCKFIYARPVFSSARCDLPVHHRVMGVRHTFTNNIESKPFLLHTEQKGP